MLRTLALFLTLSTAAQAQVTLSEEDPPFSCPPGQAIASIGCDGDFCDNISLTCRALIEDAPLTFWTNWFESGGRQSGACTDPALGTLPPRDAFASGLACRGDNCDDIALHCTAAFGGSIDRDDCVTVGLSDEDPVRRIPAGSVIAMISCSGHHCDNKDITICPYSGP